jgi:hypothetical protein
MPKEKDWSWCAPFSSTQERIAFTPEEKARAEALMGDPKIEQYMLNLKIQDMPWEVNNPGAAFLKILEHARRAVYEGEKGFGYVIDPYGNLMDLREDDPFPSYMDLLNAAASDHETEQRGASPACRVSSTYLRHRYVYHHKGKSPKRGFPYRNKYHWQFKYN